MTVLVLMKALPPTKGHEALIKFARHFGTVYVLMDYHPDEPDMWERKECLASIDQYTRIVHREVLPQKPEDDPEFWSLWTGILTNLATKVGGFDYVIGSEDYCKRVADIVNARYIPFDPDREYLYTRATDVRDDPLANYDQMMDFFQKKYRTTVTVFGAESTGKTTLSHALAENLDYAPWLFEYARPYLETVGNEINYGSMMDIYCGQRALQANARRTEQNSPYIVQDTDLFTTVGYWEQPHWAETLGAVPKNLLRHAEHEKSDLYLITQANIPFEEDRLRYGGDHRESPDEYWIGVAEKYNLNYVVLDSNDPVDRLTEALAAVRMAATTKTAPLRYDRKGAK